MSDVAPTHLPRMQRAASIARRATLFLLIATFVATHLPSVGHHSITYLDKLMHIGAYAVLAFSVLVSWELTIGPLQPPHYFTVWLEGTLYGAFDELTQIPVGRICDGLDWLSDIVGIVIGLTIFRLSRPLIYRFL